MPFARAGRYEFSRLLFDAEGSVLQSKSFMLALSATGRRDRILGTADEADLEK